ncbi:MAG: hypothetical protein QM751_04255 [Paludibacteraceae bacterium]
MKQLVYLGLFVVIFISITACPREKNNADTQKLEQLENLLSLQPEAVLDSLRQINPRLLNDYNKAYYQLIEVIAKDKTFFHFTSDSLINSAVAVLSTRRSKHPNNYARALMYQGIVRYRMGVTDSTAFLPLKKAIDIFEKQPIADKKNIYLSYLYAGQIHDTYNNVDEVHYYFTEALKYVKMNKDTSQFNYIYTELAWNRLKANEPKEAKKYIDLFKKLRFNARR